MKQGLFAELKRRHVYRVAVAYVVVGWLVIQAAATISPFLHLPDTLTTMVIVVIALGFPVALILAWAFEVTPDGMRRTQPADSPDARPSEQHRRIGRTLDRITIGVLALALVLAVWRPWHRHDATPQAAPSATAAAAVSAAPANAPASAAAPAKASTIPAKSIAVLPFENLSEDKANGYFADGMQDMILTKLADIGDLKVISRTSTMQYGSHPQNLTRIAKALGVATILEGSVQKAGDQVLINVQLIDASSDSHIWANSYRRTLKDVFGVEGEVAETIAGTLNAKLTAPETDQVTRAPTTNSAAYDAYLRARALSNRAGEDANKREIAAYREAVQHDPRFALAWAQLASAELADYWLYDPKPAVLASARQDLQKARDLAPDAAATQLALGDYEYYGREDYPSALAAFRKVLARAPNSVGALRRVARIERRLGHWQDAVDNWRKALALDPLNISLLRSMTNTFTAVRDFARARVMVNRALALDPGNGVLVLQKVWIDQATGQHAAADALLGTLKTNANTMYPQAIGKIFLHDYQGAMRVVQAGLADPSCQAHEAARTYCLLLLGYVQYLTGDRTASRANLKKILPTISGNISKAKPGPAKARATSLKAFVEMLLGDKAAALADGHAAMRIYPPDKDAIDGPSTLNRLAMIQAFVGENRAAIQSLRHLLSIPYSGAVTVPLLKVDPLYDKLRDDPDFQALLKKYAANRPTIAIKD